MRACATDHSPLRIVLQPVLSPPHCPLVQAALAEFAYENIMGHSAKSLDEVQLDHIHHSPLIQIVLKVTNAVWNSGIGVGIDIASVMSLSVFL